MGSSLDSPPEPRNRFVSFVRAMRSCVCPRDDVASEAGRPKLEKSSVLLRVPPGAVGPGAVGLAGRLAGPTASKSQGIKRNHSKSFKTTRSVNLLSFE